MKKESARTGLFIFLFFASVFLFISQGRFGGDGLENYLTAESIVRDGSFAIHNKPFEVGEMRYEDRGNLGPGNKLYSSYGLGMAFILVPFYFVGHIVAGFVHAAPHDYITQFFVSFTNPLVLAVLALVLFRFLVRLGYSKRISFYSVLVYSCATMNVAYVRSGFSEPMVALLVTIAACSLFVYSKERKASLLLAAAFCIGYTIFIKKNSLILLPGFGLYFLYLIYESYKSKKAGALVWDSLAFIAPILLSFVVIALQNKVLYGGLTHTEFGTVGDMLGKVRSDGLPIKGLYHYLISSGKGYFVYNIAFVLGLFAIKDFFKKYRAFTVFVLSLLVLNFAYYSLTFVRDSLFSWGPRYLFPTLPLMTLLFAEFIDRKTTHVRKITVGVFSALGFLIQLPIMIVSFSKYLFFAKEELGLPEYIINYMPELSPIKGAWMQLASFISRHLTGNSIVFSFNPDMIFIKPLKVVMTGYDMADIWWINVIKVDPGLLPAVVFCAAAFTVIALLSFLKVRKAIAEDVR